MRSLVLGAFIFASFGLSANAAESPSDAKVVGQHMRHACQVVTSDRTLRLLRDVLPGDRRIAADRPMSRAVSTAAKEPAVRASRPVVPVRLARAASRLEPIRFVSRSESVRVLTQHLTLMVGIGY